VAEELAVAVGGHVCPPELGAISRAVEPPADLFLSGPKRAPLLGVYLPGPRICLAQGGFEHPSVRHVADLLVGRQGFMAKDFAAHGHSFLNGVWAGRLPSAC
jgi:hypothetical protein